MAKYEAQILVRGRPVRVFKHEKDFFIEGRKGSAFEIKFINNTWDRIEVVISVDGLSVINGEQCGHETEGYIVEAKDHIIIPGWKIANNNTAAEFVFKKKDKSYAKQIDADISNVGVIGFMVFVEDKLKKEEPIMIPTPFPYPAPNPYPNPYPNPVEPWIWPTRPRKDPWREPFWISTTAGDPNKGKGYTSCNTITRSSDEVKESFDSSAVSASLTSNSVSDLKQIGSFIEDEVKNMSLFEVGVGWGNEVKHNVETVEFMRKDLYKPNKIITIYYDTLKGLRYRGVVIDKPVKKKHSLPNAFPSYTSPGCKPPPGWKK